MRLSVNGQALTEKFSVEKDPRIDSVTIADLTEQFNLALQIRDKTTEANEMVITFRDALTAVEEEVYQVRNRSGQDPLNFPIKLNNKLAALERVVETGDGKPIAGSYTVFKELSDLLAAQKGKLDAALKTDLPAVNKMLGDKGLKALEVTVTETKAPAAE